EADGDTVVGGGARLVADGDRFGRAGIAGQVHAVLPRVVAAVDGGGVQAGMGTADAGGTFVPGLGAVADGDGVLAAAVVAASESVIGADGDAAAAVGLGRLADRGAVDRADVGA